VRRRGVAGRRRSAVTPRLRAAAHGSVPRWPAAARACDDRLRMAADPLSIERALAEVGRAVCGGPEEHDFLRHRARHASDAGIVRSLHDGSRVLEIGSAPGHFTALLRLLDIPAVGVDLAPPRMQALIARFGLDVRRCDIEREPLPFDDAGFHLVVCSEVFEHLRVDPVFALTQINRVLAPGAYLLLTTPNLYAVQQIARFLTGRGIGDPLAEFMKLRTLGHMGHVREYSHREMRRFLDYAGFAVEQLRFKHYYYGGGKRGLAKRVIFALAPARLHSYQVIVARKVRASPRLRPLP
jgi:SAM-dependent methyltransferase